MNYLCIETSHSKGFVTLFLNDKKEFEYQWDTGWHSENIIGSLKELSLKESIEFIAVNVGPGRFTGIRAGVNFAKVLSYYLKCPMYPCFSLRVMSEKWLQENDCPVVCILEAFGQMYYTSIYQKINQEIKTILPPQALTLKQLEKHISQEMVGIGDVFEKECFSKPPFKNLKVKKFTAISPQIFSQYIKSYWNKSDLKNWKEIEPCYLRLPAVINKSV